LDSRGVHSKITVYDVKPEEHFVVIYNGQPGLSGLRVKVNQSTWRVRGLRPGEVRTLDIARALHFDEPNTITLIGEGPPGGSAMILIGDMEPASATLRRAQREHSDPDEDR
jgi:transglutaminase-like putative cysteine protease